MFVVKHIRGYMTSRPGLIINLTSSVDCCQGEVREAVLCI